MRVAVFVVGLLVVVAGAASLVLTGVSIPKSSEVEARSFSLDPGQKLMVRGFNGRMTYELWDEPEMKIEVTKEIAGLTPGLAQRVGQRVSVEFSHDSGGVEALARRTSGPFLLGNVRVHFHVWVPRSWSGEASISTSNGVIVVRGHTGDLKVRTSNGRIELHDIQGSLEARTSNGPIRVMSGNLAGTGRLQTSNGPIHLNVRLEDDASYDVKTSNGSVSIALVEPSVQVDLATSNGNIDLETDVTASKIDRRHVVGRIGDGLASLSVKTSNGSIRLQAN